MTQQGDRQASVRAVTGTAGTYDGDWLALFDAAGIPDGPFNGRMLAWINLRLSAAYADMAGAMQALADANGAFNFASLGIFDASGGGGGGAYSPAVQFNDSRNSQYVAAMAA